MNDIKLDDETLMLMQMIDEQDDCETSAQEAIRPASSPRCDLAVPLIIQAGLLVGARAV